MTCEFIILSLFVILSNRWFWESLILRFLFQILNLFTALEKFDTVSLFQFVLHNSRSQNHLVHRFNFTFSVLFLLKFYIIVWIIEPRSRELTVMLLLTSSSRIFFFLVWWSFTQNLDSLPSKMHYALSSWVLWVWLHLCL